MFDQFTLGIEEEFQIVDPKTRELRSHVSEFLEEGKMLLGEQIKLRRQGQPAPRSLENQRSHWAELIAVLDRADSSHPLWTEAAHMIQQGYREILHLRRNEDSGN